MESQDSPVMSVVEIKADAAEDVSLNCMKQESTGDVYTSGSIKTEAVTNTDTWKKIKCEPVDDSVAGNQKSAPVTCAHHSTDTDRQTQPADDALVTMTFGTAVKLESVVCQREDEGLPVEGKWLIGHLGTSADPLRRVKMESQDLPVMSGVKIEIDVAEDMPLDWMKQETCFSSIADWSGNTGDINGTPSCTATTTVTADTDRDLKPLPLTPSIKTEAVTGTDTWKNTQIKCEPVDDSVAVNQKREPVTCTCQETDTGRQMQPADDAIVSKTCTEVKVEVIPCKEEEAGLSLEPVTFGQLSCLAPHITSMDREQEPSVTVQSASSGTDASYGHRDEGTQRNHADTEFKCEVCSETFSKARGLNRHRRVHAEPGSYVYNEMFSCAKALKKHKQTHGRKPFGCDVCSKAFTRAEHLQKHSVVHTGHKSYGCDDCGKAFAQLDTLKRHMRVHTGYKPYHCDVCSKDFTLSGNLARHMKTHMDKKTKNPFICDVCSKALSQSGHLKIHMRIHTGNMPYVCDVCEKAFPHLSHLKRHEKVHTVTKSKKHSLCICNVCEKAFSRSSDLTKHEKIHIVTDRVGRTSQSLKGKTH